MDTTKIFTKEKAAKAKVLNLLCACDGVPTDVLREAMFVLSGANMNVFVIRLSSKSPLSQDD